MPSAQVTCYLAFYCTTQIWANISSRIQSVEGHQKIVKTLVVFESHESIGIILWACLLKRKVLPSLGKQYFYNPFLGYVHYGNWSTSLSSTIYEFSLMVTHLFLRLDFA